MDLLTIQHQDFTMYVECTKFDGIWHKAKRNVGEENLMSAYTWSEGVESVDVNGRQLAMSGEEVPAIFFDNTDYPIWVEFNEYVKNAQFGSELQNDNDRFSFRGHTLTGYINYGNDIGKSELNFVYQVGTDKRRFTLGYEVLSTKLNYHEHWKKIVEDIEEEYRMLSLDYMRRTFHGFTSDTKGETQELIWWSVFAGEQQKFIKACRSIIERPRHRLRGYEVYLRADKLKRVPSNIENELAEHRKEPAHLYRIEGKDTHHVDTPPDDAINQMHRYRDAIYYKDYTANQLKKEVIGGYILFPDDGEPADVQVSKFYKSIGEVNIGAFPLRPKDERNRVLLETFIRELINNKATRILSDSIPQKGLYYQEGEPAYLMISANHQHNVGYMEDLKKGLPCKFYCSYDRIKDDVNLQKISYLIPAFGNRFSGYYQVKSVNTKVFSNSDDSLCIEFELDNYKDLGYMVDSKTQDYIGVSFAHTEFLDYCSSHRINE